MATEAGQNMGRATYAHRQAVMYGQLASDCELYVEKLVSGIEDDCK